MPTAARVDVIVVGHGGVGAAAAGEALAPGGSNDVSIAPNCILFPSTPHQSFRHFGFFDSIAAVARSVPDTCTLL